MKWALPVFNEIKENYTVLLHWSLMALENVRPARQETTVTCSLQEADTCVTSDHVCHDFLLQKLMF